MTWLWDDCRDWCYKMFWPFILWFVFRKSFMINVFSVTCWLAAWFYVHFLCKITFFVRELAIQCVTLKLMHKERKLVIYSTAAFTWLKCSDSIWLIVVKGPWRVHAAAPFICPTYKKKKKIAMQAFSHSSSDDSEDYILKCLWWTLSWTCWSHDYMILLIK